MESSVASAWPARLRSGPWLFICVVVVPSVLAIAYFLLIASPRYVSEARFVVRSRDQAAPAALGSALQTIGVDLAPGQTDAFEVHEYMTSRDAVSDLERHHDLRGKLGRPGADFIARFPRPFQSDRFEDLFQNYRRFVTVGYDSTTGISTLRVEAFRPEDAQEIASALLVGGEGVVNRLNDRAASDAVSLARRQLAEAEMRSGQAQSALTQFRNREQLIDPSRSSVAELELLTGIETQLASLRAERASLAASAPRSPQLPTMDDKIRAFEAQLEAERARMAGETNSLAPKVGEYDQLIMDREFASKMLETAAVSLESARLEAQRQQLYLERVVNPNKPDKPLQPRRLKSIALVVATSLMAYAIIALVLAGLREHRQY